MSTQRSSATDPGAGLIAALAERDFRRLAGTLTPAVRMRALIPPGLVELSGAEDAAAKFSAWFGDAEEFELIRSGSDAVADRLHVFYRLRVKKPGSSRSSEASAARPTTSVCCSRAPCTSSTTTEPSKKSGRARRT